MAQRDAMRTRDKFGWCAGGVACAIVVGWLAARIHASGHAPIGLTSLGVGAFLGFAVSQLAVMLRIAGRRLLLSSAAFFAIVLVIAQHAWLYHDFRRQWQAAREKSATVALLRPESPPSPLIYFAHEWNPALWVADAMLILTGGVGVVVVMDSGGRFGPAPDAKDAVSNERDGGSVVPYSEPAETNPSLNHEP